MNKKLAKLKHDTDPNTPVKIKRDSRPLSASFVLWLIVVAVVGFLIYTYVVMVSKPNTEHNETAAATLFTAPKTLVNEVKPDLKDSQLVVTSTSGIGGKTANGFWAYGVPFYQAEGKRFKTQPAESVGVAYASDSKTAQMNYDVLTKFFADNNFTKLSSTSKKPGAIAKSNPDTTYVAYSEYESTQMLCAIYKADATKSVVKAYVVGLGCASKESYKTAAESLQPYYEAYAAIAKKPSNDMAFSLPVVKKATKGYEYATVYQEDPNQFTGGFNGFYYLAPHSTWDLFTLSQTTVACKAYDSAQLKKAFAGIKCYDKATNSATKLG